MLQIYNKTSNIFHTEKFTIDTFINKCNETDNGYYLYLKIYRYLYIADIHLSWYDLYIVYLYLADRKSKIVF